MKTKHIERTRVCNCEAWPLCEHAPNAAKPPLAGHDRYGWFVIFPPDNMSFITREEFRSAMPDGKAAKHTAAAPEMEAVLVDALADLESNLPMSMCAMMARIKAVLYKVHPKVLHGQCPVCGHYGEDCTGREPS